MDETRRWVRADMASVSDADARKYLEEFREIVRSEALGGHVDEREDLTAIGNIAVIEGIISWDEQRKGKRCSRKHWVRQVVKWRMREYLTRTAMRSANTLHLEELRHDQHSWEEVLPDKQAQCPEQLALAQGRLQQVVGRLTRLPRRDQVLVDGGLRGESIATVAKTLGITKQRASVVQRTAVSRLRVVCSRDR